LISFTLPSDRQSFDAGRAARLRFKDLALSFDRRTGILLLKSLLK
jgi:hypothetical protein